MLKLSSKNVRFPKEENSKPRIIKCICSSGVQAFKFRDAFESDAEIRELWSIEWLNVLRLMLGRVPQPLLRNILIKESEKFHLGTRQKRLSTHKDSETIFTKTYCGAHFSLGNL